WSFMSETITTVIGYATEIGNGIINTLTEIINTGKNTVIQALTTIWETIKGMVQTVIDIGKSIGDGLMNAISGAVESGIQALQSVLDGIVSVAQATYDKIMNLVNKAKSAASGLSNLVTTGTLAGGEQIQLGPAMQAVNQATGGIIQSSKGGTLVRAAEAGMNEAFVPLPDGKSIPISFNNLPDFSALTRGNNESINVSFGDITINNKTDEKEFLKQIESTVSNALVRRNGRR
ncbi:MAG TPA: hypothetical protein PKI46_00005, partial [Bacteroidales bacterium]|nr:hypothetical protein [Bacteroidales bacterium]